MAANESNYECDEEDIFQTALEDQFTELSLNNTDEFNEISRITVNNDVTTPGYEADDDHSDIDDSYLASTLQNALNIGDSPKPAVNFIETNSSTPKRKLQFIRNPKNVIVFNEITEEAEYNSQECIENHQSAACKQEESVLSEPLLPSSINLPSEIETDTLTQLPSLSQLIREQRRSHILSPFSQKLKHAIIRQDRLQKRQQRIEMSKKAQRVSLRV